MTASRMNVELMPDMAFPVVTTITAYPGASPEDVVEQVTKPIEQAVSNVSGIKRVQSTSVESLSIVIAEFEFGRDIDRAEADMQSALSKISLPQNAQTPRTARIDLNDLPVVQIALTGDVSPTELRRIASDRLLPELSKVEGVYSVDMVGGQMQEVHVILDPAKAAEKGITFQQVAALLQANSLELPAGSVEVDGLEIPVRTLHRFQTIDEVKEMAVGVDRSVLAGASNAGLVGMPQTDGAPNGEGGLQGLQQPSLSAGPQSSTPQVRPKAVVHTVEVGDTVGELAERYGTTIQAIAQASHLADPDRIYAGQRLVIPQPLASDSAPTSASDQNLNAQDIPDQSQSLPMVKLSDIASVTLEAGKTGGISRTNGKPSVLLMVAKTQDANTVEVADAVLEKIEKLKGQLDGDVEMVIVADESSYVERSIQGLGREGLMGMVIAVLVIFAFLGNLRGTMIIAVSIPLSVAIALLAMEWQQLTFNIMTLAGLAVAVGRVVDDGIVVLENAHRHLQAGAQPATAARRGTAEVAMPVTASTLTTVAVFLPLGFIGGIVGQAFRPFALTVTFALLASLLVALTVVPVLCRLLMSPGHKAAMEGRDLGMDDLLPERGPSMADQPPNQTGNGHARIARESWLLRLYTPLLRWVLFHPIATIVAAIVLLMASLSLIPRIPTAFLSSDQEKRLTVQIAPPPGASVAAVADKAAEVEDILSNTPDVALYQTTIGDEAGALASMRTVLSGQGSGGATVQVRLDDKADLNAVTANLRDEFNKIQGEGRISVISEESMGTSKVRLVVSGEDQASVKKAAAKVEDALKDLSGLANISSDSARETSEILIQVEPSKAAELGLTTAELAGSIRGMVAGQAAGSLKQPEGSLDITISVPRDSVDSPETLGKLLFGSPKPTPLAEMAKIQQENRSAQITRVDQSQAIDINADIVADDAGAVSNDVRDRIESLMLPDGISVDYGGVMEQLSEGFSAMGMGQIVGVILVFMVMAIFFNSVLDPLVILVSLPLAAIGAIPALYFTGRTLSMSAMIGMLMLIGIVVTNAIVLLDFARRPIRDGWDPRRALLEAGRIRMRPILMTALTTVLALAPLALGLEGGSIIAAELAVVVMGGLLSSTLLTLLVVPAVYCLVCRRNRRPIDRA